MTTLEQHLAAHQLGQRIDNNTLVCTCGDFVRDMPGTYDDPYREHRAHVAASWHLLREELSPASRGRCVVTSLEQHLAEHWLSGVQPDDWAYFCECGEKLADNDEDVDLDQAQRAHVAATWREARTVRTVEELDALDGEAVVMLLHSTGEPHGERMNAAHTMCRKWIETGLALLIIWDPEGGAL